MSIIYLVRHGQASFSADNYDKLSALGETQATLIGQYLKEKVSHPNHIVTGGMLRHNQTAEYSLANYAAQTVARCKQTSDPRWNEYDHQNILGQFKAELTTPQGVRRYLADKEKPLEHFQQLFIAAINQWTELDTPSAIALGYNESFEQFCQRVLAALDSIVEAQSIIQDKDRSAQKNTATSKVPSKTQRTLVYTSGGPISLIACHLLGLPLKQFISINWGLVNCGITKLVTRGKSQKLSLSSLNEHHIFEQQLNENNEKLITYT